MAIYLLSSPKKSLSLLLPSKDWRKNRKTLGDTVEGILQLPLVLKMRITGEVSVHLT